MKIVRNSDYYQPKEQYNVKCSKYNKDAAITIFYRSVEMCKTDIQLTAVELGIKCSLWDENKPACPQCLHFKNSRL